MNTVPSQFGFYAILTSPVCGYEYCTKVMVDHEIAFVQLRMKKAKREDIIRTAEKMKAITDGTKTRLIINDYADVAAASGADGVHVGQHDMAYSDVRRIVGAAAIVGISTHNRDQTHAACMLKPDYIGIGPVWPTPTKENPDPPVGIEGMKDMLSCATVPAVVLGSITLDNLNEILDNGAKNFSMVRPVNQSDKPEKVLKKIVSVYRRAISG
jgi:thiamine-phosphate pyrophosphorylase